MEVTDIPCWRWKLPPNTIELLAAVTTGNDPVGLLGPSRIDVPSTAPNKFMGTDAEGLQSDSWMSNVSVLWIPKCTRQAYTHSTHHICSFSVRWSCPFSIFRLQIRNHPCILVLSHPLLIWFSLAYQSSSVSHYQKDKFVNRIHPIRLYPQNCWRQEMLRSLLTCHQRRPIACLSDIMRLSLSVPNLIQPKCHNSYPVHLMRINFRTFQKRLSVQPILVAE